MMSNDTVFIIMVAMVTDILWRCDKNDYKTIKHDKCPKMVK
jgi:hypothetical protein